MKKQTISILIIDTDSAQTQSFISKIQEAGYNILFSTNWQNAFENIAIHKPQAIIIDPETPNIDIHKLCMTIRHTLEDNTAIILFSKIDAKILGKITKEYNANIYVSKNDLNGLLAVIPILTATN